MQSVELNYLYLTTSEHLVAQLSGSLALQIRLASSESLSEDALGLEKLLLTFAADLSLCNNLIGSWLFRCLVSYTVSEYEAPLRGQSANWPV